ncbi:unnamed protein product, partial [Prorocentrum cordatum]
DPFGPQVDASFYIFIPIPRLLKDGAKMWRSASDIVLTDGSNGIAPAKYFMQSVTCCSAAALDIDDVLLGFALSSKPGRWRPAAKKFWRARGCIQHVLEPGRCLAGRQLRRLAGHMAPLLLLRRGPLGMLSTAASPRGRGAGAPAARRQFGDVQAAGGQPESTGCRGRRPLGPGDNASMMYAQEKGRASDFGMLPGRRAALAMLNPADGPARRARPAASRLSRRQRALCRPASEPLVAARAQGAAGAAFRPRVLQLLASWLAVGALPDWAAPARGATLADFPPRAFDRGVARATAELIGSALPRGPPQFRAALQRRCLPQLARAAAGWKRLQPPGSRPPLPELAARAAVAWPFLRGEGATAPAPRAAQINGPLGNASAPGNYASAAARATELGRPGMAWGVGRASALDLPRQQALARALARLRDGRPGRWRPFWGFDCGFLQRRFSPALHAAVLAAAMKGCHGRDSRVFVELLSGSGNLSRRLRQAGHAVIEWDMLRRPKLDLNRQVWALAGKFGIPVGEENLVSNWLR